jgi:hypothetical protein
MFGASFRIARMFVRSLLQAEYLMVAGTLDRSSRTVPEALEILAQATRDNWEHRDRLGNVVVLTPESADDILITADLHGHRENFNRIKELADLDRNPRRHLILQEVCHGGPQDDEGGCRSHQMLCDVAALKVQFPGRVHYLLSNHELSELTDYPLMKSGSIWMLTFRLGIKNAYGPEWESVLTAYKQFIASCPLAICLPSDIFVSHSIPERVNEVGFDTSVFHRTLSDIDLGISGPVGQLVWGRDYKPENAAAFSDLVHARVLINGHTPCDGGVNVLNQSQQIILDCCRDDAAYLRIPLRYSLRFKEIVSQIAKLN